MLNKKKLQDKVANNIKGQLEAGEGVLNVAAKEGESLTDELYELDLVIVKDTSVGIGPTPVELVKALLHDGIIQFWGCARAIGLALSGGASSRTCVIKGSFLGGGENAVPRC